MRYLLLLALTTAGCGTVKHTCSDRYDYDMKPTAPFNAVAKCDGQIVLEASGPQRAYFYVSCPDGMEPSYKDGGEVTCVTQ